TTHVLLLCPFAASIWRDSGVWNYVEAAVNGKQHCSRNHFSVTAKFRGTKICSVGCCYVEHLEALVDQLLEDWRAAKNTQKTNNAAEAEIAAAMPLSRVQLHRQEQAGMCWQEPETSRIHGVVGITTNDE
ncbi:hypothetical protein A2U01_0001278, partial [Trifolium medium]|nr:hypothetical protein [Trifolium medium]